MKTKGEKKKKNQNVSQMFPFHLRGKQFFLSQPMSLFRHLLAVSQYQNQATECSIFQIISMKEDKGKAAIWSVH